MSEKRIATAISNEAHAAGKTILEAFGGTWSDLFEGLLEDRERAGAVYEAWRKRTKWTEVKDG